MGCLPPFIYIENEAYIAGTYVITAFVNILTLWSKEEGEVTRIIIGIFFLVSDNKHQVLSFHHV
jgi:hypothetical protein